MFNKPIKFFKSLVPAYAIVPLLLCLFANFLIYGGANIVTADLKHYDFTTSFDRSVPLIPSFVSIYLGCYIFWVVNYIMIARLGKEYCMRFVSADILSRLICGIFYLFLPTTNIRPLLTGDGVWVSLLRLVYEIDPASNLFPSIHCLVSWLCFAGIRKNEKIPKAYRIFSCLFALLVCVSTQVTKQHYFVDIIGGLVIAEFVFYMGFHTDWYRGLEKLSDKLTAMLSGRKKEKEAENGQ